MFLTAHHHLRVMRRRLAQAEYINNGYNSRWAYTADLLVEAMTRRST